MFFTVYIAVFNYKKIAIQNTVTYRQFAAVSKHDKYILFYCSALQSIKLMLATTHGRIYAMCYTCAWINVSNISGDDTKMDRSNKK